MEEENILDFNFWPSFSDLMLTLTLILVLVLFLVSAILNVGTIDLSHVEDNQEDIIKKIGDAFGVVPVSGDEKTEQQVGPKENLHIISLTPNSEGDIFIKNEPTMQKIAFSSHILFPPDEVELDKGGKDVLEKVGNILKKNIGLIREIQIQGHADPTKTQRYKSNMHLAAMRAISVFNFLHGVIGIDPAKHLMSTTSFGEYKPVQRSEDDRECDWEAIEKYNKSKENKDRNRRIELLIFYRYLEKEPQKKQK